MTVTPSLSRVDVYDFALAASDDPICRVRQRVWRFNQDIRFHGAAGGDVMRIRARPRFDPWARYELTDERRETIGEIQKVFGQSLIRSTYKLYDSGGAETATARERNLVVALLRRLVGFVPYVGNFADWLPIPYHFEFRRDGQVLGTHTRKAFKIGDRYTIDFSGDPNRTVDRRLILAIAVGMDALQAR